MKTEEKIKSLGLTLPSSPSPVANYVGAVRTGNLLFISGHGPHVAGEGPRYIGKLGRDLGVEEGYAAARQVCLNCLATVKASLGDLDKVQRVVKLLGFVNSAAGFQDQPKVINGASDLLVEIFADRGRHARSAVGMAELPGGIAVEVEMVLEVAD
ncbi:MAG: RidA family protein [Dehalococcoidales bacterium]|nr:RidA family protein [Dehalococcoidales bacterium]